MDVSVNVVFCNSLYDSLGTLDVHIEQTEVLGWVGPSDEVEDYVGMSDGLFERLCISQIIFQEADSAQVSSDLQMPLGHLLSVWYNDLTSCPRESVDDVSTEKAGRTEDRDCMTSQ